MPTESLILRRSYPVPVTFADLRRAATEGGPLTPRPATDQPLRYIAPASIKFWWHAALKEATGGADEVYAVIDGREVRVATIIAVPLQATAFIDGREVHVATGVEHGSPYRMSKDISDLLIKADEAGYWQNPHEIVHVLSERPVSFAAVERAVNVGWCAKGGAA